MSLVALRFGTQARKKFLSGRTSAHNRSHPQRWLCIFASVRYWSGFARTYREFLPLPNVDQQGHTASWIDGLGPPCPKKEYRLRLVGLRTRIQKSPPRLHNEAVRRDHRLLHLHFRL